MSCSLSLQLCIRFCNGSANQYQKRAGLKKPGRCKHTETEDGTVGCQLLVGRSLTKHLHHRPYLLRENIVSSVIKAVLYIYYGCFTQLSNWEMWETASNKLGGGLELPNPRILLYKR